MRTSWAWMGCAAFASVCLVELGTAQALPARPPSEHVGVGTFIEQVQLGPGYYRRKEYRREMRRYRGNPGAQYITRQKRQQFCRDVPSHC